MATWQVARQVAFYAPADGLGKWHAAWKISHAAVCGVRSPLGAEAIRTSVGQQAASVHKIVCRRCLRLSTWPGVSANGIEQ